MCEPITLTAALSLAATAVGGVMSYKADMDAANAAEDQATYQASIAHRNYIMAERMAVDAEDRGRIAEQEQRLRTRQLIGQQRASFAGSGVRLGDSGTINTEADAAAFGELDALTVRANAMREASGFRTQGMNFQSEGALATAAGKSRASNLRTSAFGSALNTTGTVANQWYQFNEAGVFDRPPIKKKSTTSSPHFFTYG